MLREATRRQREGVQFSGVFYARQHGISIGDAIEQLDGTPRF